jgi:hypothetical protein
MTAELGKRDQSAVWAEEPMANGSKQEQTHIILCSQLILAVVRISLTTYVDFVSTCYPYLLAQRRSRLE